MNQVRLYADENFPIPVVEVLRQLGCDVLTVADDGNAGQQVPDEVILARASELERALVTLNRKHFIRLHNERSNHQGIIVCTFDPDFEGQAKRIYEAIGTQTSLAGQLVRVNRPIE